MQAQDVSAQESEVKECEEDRGAYLRPICWAPCQSITICRLEAAGLQNETFRGTNIRGSGERD